MSENHWHAASSPSKLVKKPRSSSRTPMASDRLFNTATIEHSTGRTQLISPPPEETLHFRRSSGTTRPTPFTPSLLASNSKRKRNVRQTTEPNVEPLQPPETTPNPKPRKQSKHRPVPLEAESPTRALHRSPTPTTPSKSRSTRNFTKSPHADNPDADFIPPIISSASRRDTLSTRARRTTPIPAYEPPPDVFTPPRVITLTPTISKSSKRKSASKPKPRRISPEALRVVIKKELPSIDLSAPMPPPSPTDDPLLLTSSPMPISPAHQRRSVGVATSSPIQEQSTLPPSSSPPDDELPDGHQFDWGHSTSSDFNTSMDVDTLPLFNLNLPGTSDIGDGGWSDSEDDHPINATEGAIGEGEYTGRFRTLTVRTKQDPPSSATKDRMDRWGRPITPFPWRKMGRLDLVKEVAEEKEEKEDNPEEEGGEEKDGEEGNGEEEEEDMEEEEEEDMEEEEEEDMEEEEDTEMEGQESVQGSYGEDEEEEREVREMSVESEEEEVPANPEDITPFDSGQEPIHQDAASGAFAFDKFVNTISAQEDADGQATQNISTSAMSAGDQDVNSEHEHSYIEDDAVVDEEQELREMSDIDDDGDPPIATPSRSTNSLTPSTSRQANSSTRLVSFPTTQTVEEDVDQDEVELENTPEEYESDTSDEVESNVVKISSADPRAAARAAAILKQYDYDCYTKIMLKQRQRHSLGIHGVSSGGITKSTNAKEKQRRRTTLGTSVVIGDRVYMPGSPATTLPELLKEAEYDVSSSGPSSHSILKPIFFEPHSSRSPFETPIRRSSVSATAVPSEIVLGERQWTKDDWKLLDACFTDERIALSGVEGIASVDRVHPEDVVARFLDILGGSDVVETFGNGWDSDSLVQRVKALQNKQRSGNVAPPTTPYTPNPSAFNHSRQIPSMEVPDFTPLGPRTHPLARASKPRLPPPIVENAPFANIPSGKDKESIRLKTKLPMTLLAPRYSHLLEEAVAISQLSPQTPNDQVADPDPDDAHSDSASVNEDQTRTGVVSGEDEPETFATPQPPSPPRAPTTIGKRVEGFLFSYLPTLSKTAPPSPRKGSHHLLRQPGLPLPPPDLIDKARGPINTPARVAPPKAPHPKELVHLNPAPLPPTKPTMIPKAKAKRLVDLNPVTPPPQKEKEIPRPRRSSGGSVKDLVKTFEQMESQKEAKQTAELRRVKSIGDWRKTAGPQAGSSSSGKPSWRP